MLKITTQNITADIGFSVARIISLGLSFTQILRHPECEEAGHLRGLRCGDLGGQRCGQSLR
jgi:hypothetical protein